MRAVSWVRVSGEQAQQLVVWGRGASPHEACGVLLGIRSPQAVIVERVIQTVNLSTATGAFVCDPGALVVADRASRAAGLEVVGFWHSHPDGDALPSTRDVTTAWPRAIHLIVAPDSHQVLRAWQFEDSTHIELALVTEVLAPWA